MTQGRLSPFMFKVLACLPKEPCMAAMSDLVADLVPDMKVSSAICKVLTALGQIRRRYGLVEGKLNGKAGYAVPADVWEKAVYDAEGAMEKANEQG